MWETNLHLIIYLFIYFKLSSGHFEMEEKNADRRSQPLFLGFSQILMFD